jgi:hypothetical protein
LITRCILVQKTWKLNAEICSKLLGIFGVQNRGIWFSLMGILRKYYIIDVLLKSGRRNMEIYLST